MRSPVRTSPTDEKVSPPLSEKIVVPFTPTATTRVGLVNVDEATGSLAGDTRFQVLPPSRVNSTSRPPIGVTMHAEGLPQRM